MEPTVRVCVARVFVIAILVLVGLLAQLVVVIVAGIMAATLLMLLTAVSPGTAAELLIPMAVIQTMAFPAVTVVAAADMVMEVLAMSTIQALLSSLGPCSLGVQVNLS